MTTKGTSVAVAISLLLGAFVLSSSTSLDRNAPNGGATKLGGRNGAVWHVSTLGSDSTGDGSLPAPFSTIQNGIDHASDGDTVLVQDGTYHERVSFRSKAVVVGSWILRDLDTLHAQNTIIDGDSAGLPAEDTLSVVRIVDVVGIPQLVGFTIVNGPTEGILCTGAGALVANCILVNNGFRKSYGVVYPSTDPVLEDCRLINCGIGSRSGPLVLKRCNVDGLVEGVGPEALVEADSCMIGGVDIFGTGYFHARSSLIYGDITRGVAGCRLIDCTVNGRIASIDASLVADSCMLGEIRCGNESFNWIYRSEITGPIKFFPSDLPPWLTLSHCTVLDSIVRLSGNAKLWIDSSNLALPAPIDLGGSQTWEYLSIDANCSNVYADGVSPWANVGSSPYATFDTVGVFSLPPQFCNPGVGDYRVFDTSPCAPENNPCGVLIGARDIGCINEHVWHVSTTGSDSTGNGTEVAPFATIQKGIDRAVDGDTVLVADGIYHERVTYYDKSIVVGSWLLRDGDTVHIANTIINGDPMGLPASDTTAVVRFVGIGANVSTLRGLTVTAGGTEVDGVLSISSNPCLKQCKFENVDVIVRTTSYLSTPVIRESQLINGGVNIESTTGVQVKIGHSLVQGELSTAASYSSNYFYVDSSTVGKVDLRTHGWLISRGSIFEDTIKGYVTAHAQIIDCIAWSGIYLGTEAVLHADSSIIDGIGCGNEFYCYVNNSVVTGPIKVIAPYDIEPYITLRHSTVVDSILRISGRRIFFKADTCNIVLPAPIALDDNWERLYFRCCNIYANGDHWYTGTPDTGGAWFEFDTTQVISLPPQFCNPGIGDCTVFDTSPCAPANNECGVLIGAKGIGCINEHVWHVSTLGNDIAGNGSIQYPFKTIQRGISQASEGDTVLVADGLYHERISFYGKPIVVGSWILRDDDSVHIANTIIDGDTAFTPMVGDTGSVVRFVQSEDSNSVLAGLTVRGATGTYSTGAGVLCGYGSPRIVDCHLTGNIGTNSSAIISLGSPVFLRCRIFGNSRGARVFGASIRLNACYVDSLQEILSDGDTYASGSTFRSVRFGSPNSMSGRVTIDRSLFYNCNIDYGIRATLTSDSLYDSNVIVWDQDTAEITECVFLRSLLYVNDAHCNVRRSRMEDGITVFAQNLQRILIEDSFIGDTLRIFGGNNTKLTAAGSTFDGHGIALLGTNKNLNSIKIDRCIIKTAGEPALTYSPTQGTMNNDTIHVSCCDVVGYSGEEWLSGTATVVDTSSILRGDPMFCDSAAGDYHIHSTSACAPGNNPCGVQIGAYGIGCLDSGDDNWTFGNSEANMWPESWWQQFNYCYGVSPCDQLCLLCSPSTFPDWDLFASAVGDSAAYFDPPPGNVTFRPSAVAQWEALRGDWTGSCFGFAASGFLFFDDYLDVGSYFPGHSELSTVPNNDESRRLINKFYLYQFGAGQQSRINSAVAAVAPAQTLAECQAMFARVPRNDQVLMMFNQLGVGGHAVAPYRCQVDGANPSLWYVYVHDSNIPNDTTQRVAVDLETNSWTYSGQPGWGGNTGLFLLDTVSTYLSPLVLADTTKAIEKISFFFGEADSVVIGSETDSIGFSDQEAFGEIEGVSPIVPADGAETVPLGYMLPSGEWYFRASGVIDGVFTVLDGEKRIFRHGGAKSGIISCNYSTNDTSASLTVYGWSRVKSGHDIYDSSFIEVISVTADSETVVNISGMGLVNGDSVSLTLNPNQTIQVDNFGDATSYDLEIQIVNAAQNEVFYCENVAIGESTSHLIIPDWRQQGDSLIVAIDTSMSDVFDSSMSLHNQVIPQFVCGDADGNKLVTISDAVYLINYIFAGGPAPNPKVRGDADCNGLVTISDAVYLINYIFAGGARPCAACP